jgi:hypothetical protein
MEEHWPTGVLLWAIGALVGWGLLRSWPQMAMAALLVPFWLIGEWTEAVRPGTDVYPIGAAFCALLAICYLSVRNPQIEVDDSVARTFAWIGGIAVLPSVLALVLWRWSPRGIERDSIEIAGWMGAFLLPLGFAFIYRRARAWMNLIAALWVLALTDLVFLQMHVAVYGWCAVGAAGMIAWGMVESRAERVNLGMAGFALTVLCFYFSDVMDKFGRSTSLILLGVTFLAGAWYWEKLRRKLVARIQTGGAV